MKLFERIVHRVDEPHIVRYKGEFSFPLKPPEKARRILGHRVRVKEYILEIYVPVLVKKEDWLAVIGGGTEARSFYEEDWLLWGICRFVLRKGKAVVCSLKASKRVKVSEDILWALAEEFIISEGADVIFVWRGSVREEVLLKRGYRLGKRYYEREVGRREKSFAKAMTCKFSDPYLDEGVFFCRKREKMVDVEECLSCEYYEDRMVTL